MNTEFTVNPLNFGSVWRLPDMSRWTSDGPAPATGAHRRPWALGAKDLTLWGSRLVHEARTSALRQEQPVLVPPQANRSSEMLLITLESLFQEIQKSLCETSQQQISRAQDAHRELLAKNLVKLEKQIERERDAEAKRKQARVFGLLTKIAAAVLTFTVLAVAAATTPVTGPAGVMLALGALSMCGALIDLAGSASAMKEGDEGFTLGTLLKKAGIEQGSEAVACALTMNLGGLTAEGLKESGLDSKGVLALSLLVSIAQAFLMMKATAKWADPTKLRTAMESLVKTTQEFSLAVGGLSQFMGGACTIDAANHQFSADKRRSEIAKNDADRTQLDQSVEMYVEFIQSLMKKVQESFNATKRMIEEWESSMATLMGAPTRHAAMA